MLQIPTILIVFIFYFLSFSYPSKPLIRMLHHLSKIVKDFGPVLQVLKSIVSIGLHRNVASELGTQQLQILIKIFTRLCSWNLSV